MHCAVFLYIAAIFHHNTAPVAAQCCARAYVYILTNYYIPGYHCLWMNESAGMYDGYKTFKAVKHKTAS